MKFSKDILWNIDRLINAARFIEWRRDQSAFFEFRYRREIEDARYAWSLLQLVAEPQFCETLVHRCPWDAAAILHQISNKRLAGKAAECFVREIGRQAIICPTSMIGREIGYKGFHAAPVLSQALFGDLFISKYYQPISGLEFNDFENVDKNTVARLMNGLRSTLKTALDNGAYWNNYSLARMADHLENVTRDAHRQVRMDKSNYQLVLNIQFGLTSLIDDAVTHLGILDQATYNKLYASFEFHGDMILDCISDAIINVLNAFANDFEGYEDVFWSISLQIIRNIFDRYGDQPDGMNPLQQKVAIRLIN